MEVTCYSYEGVDAIKAALRKGLEHSTEQVPVSQFLTNFLGISMYILYKDLVFLR